MRAISVNQGQFISTECDDPKLDAGQVLVRTLTCGICGTDLHARKHLDDMLNALIKSGMPTPVPPGEPVYLGHEFCAEILEHGPSPKGQRFKPGTRVVGLPYLLTPQGMVFVGFSERYPGGFSEHMVLTESMLFEVPENLSTIDAALTEPFAVGAHAVARANIHNQSSISLVVGCGPIGLAVIAALKSQGIGPVIAMDLSQGRRKFAELMGADEVVDPAIETRAAVWSRWKAGRGGKRPVVFECVGIPGFVQSIIDDAPHNSLVVVVGNVQGESHIDQGVAFNKELDISFSLTYTAQEFQQTLYDLAERRIPTEGIITAIVRPENISKAFDDLADTERHAKIVVNFE